MKAKERLFSPETQTCVKLLPIRFRSILIRNVKESSPCRRDIIPSKKKIGYAIKRFPEMAKIKKKHKRHFSHFKPLRK